MTRSEARTGKRAHRIPYNACQSHTIRQGARPQTVSATGPLSRRQVSWGPCRLHSSRRKVDTELANCALTDTVKRVLNLPPLCDEPLPGSKAFYGPVGLLDRLLDPAFGTLRRSGLLLGSYTNLSSRISAFGPTLKLVLSTSVTLARLASPVRISSFKCAGIADERIRVLLTKNTFRSISNRGRISYV
jgi:hypothetical protein